MISAIIGSIIVGLIIGAVARLILPGKQDLSILMTIAIGVGSSLVVGIVLGAVLGDHAFISWIVSVIVACGAIVLYGKVTGKEQINR